MEVTMIAKTFFGNRKLSPGQNVGVDAATASRWIAKGIAEEAEEPAGETKETTEEAEEPAGAPKAKKAK